MCCGEIWLISTIALMSTRGLGKMTCVFSPKWTTPPSSRTWRKGSWMTGFLHTSGQSSCRVWSLSQHLALFIDWMAVCSQGVGGGGVGLARHTKTQKRHIYSLCYYFLEVSWASVGRFSCFPVCRRGNSVSDEVEDPCKGLLVSAKKLSTPKERKRITISSYPTRGYWFALHAN